MLKTLNSLSDGILNVFDFGEAFVKHSHGVVHKVVMAAFHLFEGAQKQLFNFDWDQSGVLSLEEGFSEFLKVLGFVDQVVVLLHDALFLYRNQVLHQIR